jgi:hypothetical protein
MSDILSRFSKTYKVVLGVSPPTLPHRKPNHVGEELATNRSQQRTIFKAVSETMTQSPASRSDFACRSKYRLAPSLWALAFAVVI